MMNRMLKNVCHIGLTVCMVMGSMGTVWAQDADAILKKTETALRAAKGLAVSYTYKADGESGRGSIQMKGQKFVNKMSGQTVWFNGKTMWTLVKANEEVNVTTPTTAQIAAMNPYGFLAVYKNGYTAKTTTHSSQSEYVVTLTPKNKDKQNITLKINRKSFLPTSVKVHHSMAGDIAISITSIKTNQKYSDSTFSFNSKAYPNYDVIDLR